MKRVKILLQGYIGHQNFGDDLLFEIAINRIKHISNVEIYVSITDEKLNPEYLKNYYSNLIIVRFDGKLPLLFNNRFDIVYYIGGGILFDYKAKMELIPFFKNYISNIIRFRIPKMFGTKFGGIGLGIGPYFNKKSIKLHKQIISSFDFLGVRDEMSYQLAKPMNAKKLFLTNDLSIGYEVLPKDQNQKDQIIICPRTYKHKTEFEKHITELLKFAETLENSNGTTHWIFLQNDDNEVINRIKGKYKLTIWNPFEQNIRDFIELFVKVKVVYSSRMHSLYIAGLASTPFIGIEIHQKLLYASELFYDKPILINPTAGINEYMAALIKIENKMFNKDKLQIEKEILKDINKKFLIWLEAICANNNK